MTFYLLEEDLLIESINQRTSPPTYIPSNTKLKIYSLCRFNSRRIVPLSETLSVKGRDSKLSLTKGNNFVLFFWRLQTHFLRSLVTRTLYTFRRVLRGEGPCFKNRRRNSTNQGMTLVGFQVTKRKFWSRVSIWSSEKEIQVESFRLCPTVTFYCFENEVWNFPSFFFLVLTD